MTETGKTEPRVFRSLDEVRNAYAKEPTAEEIADLVDPFAYGALLVKEATSREQTGGKKKS